MKRIEELKLKIKQASDAYGAASPIMSDKEFDQLVNELKSLDPTYVDTVTYDDHTEGFEKGKHDLVTGTLAKCRNEEEFEKWFEKHPGTKEMEVKLDGCVSKDTIVETENGEKTIEEVVKGNDTQILSYNEETNKVEFKTIKKKMHFFTEKKWYKIKFDNGLELKITENDFLRIKNGSYRMVLDLQIGDEVLIK